MKRRKEKEPLHAAHFMVILLIVVLAVVVFLSLGYIVEIIME